MTEYDGKLYVGTFDTSSLLEPIGQFSNGDINDVGQGGVWESLLAFIRTLLKLQQKEQGDGTNASSANQEDPRMEPLTQLLRAPTPMPSWRTA